MLNTFDENLVITAVQQLATDLTSLSGRIKKLEDNGGGSPKLIAEKTYDNIEITDTTEQLFDTINLGEDFLLATNEMLVVFTNFDTDHANPKVLTDAVYFTNPIGALTGNRSRCGIDMTYNTSGGTPTANNLNNGIYAKTLDLTNKSIEVDSKYSSAYGYVGGTVTIKVYKVQILPSI